MMRRRSGQLGFLLEPRDGYSRLPVYDDGYYSDGGIVSGGDGGSVIPINEPVATKSDPVVVPISEPQPVQVAPSPVVPISEPQPVYKIISGNSTVSSPMPIHSVPQNVPVSYYADPAPEPIVDYYYPDVLPVQQPSNPSTAIVPVTTQQPTTQQPTTQTPADTADNGDAETEEEEQHWLGSLLDGEVSQDAGLLIIGGIAVIVLLGVVLKR